MMPMKISKTTNLPKKKKNSRAYIIVNIEANKILNPIVTELFLRGRKLNISIVSQ